MLFLPWQNAWKTSTVPFSLTITLTVHTWSSSFLVKAFMKLVLLGEVLLREVITNISLLFNNISATQSKSTVLQQMKGSAIKIPVSSLDVIKSIIGVWVASTWSTKEQQLTILIVNLQLDFIYLFFFLIWWMQLVSRGSSFTIWCIKTIKVLVAWTWSTIEQQLTILIVNL